MYMLQECRLLLQRDDQMVVNTRNDDLDSTRPLDAIAFAAMPSARSAAESVEADSDSAVKPVPEEAEPLTFSS